MTVVLSFTARTGESQPGICCIEILKASSGRYQGLNDIGIAIEQDCRVQGCGTALCLGVHIGSGIYQYPDKSGVVSVSGCNV